MVRKCVTTLLLAWVVTVQCLPIYQKYKEGECERIRPPTAKNVNRRALAEMRYIVGGSKYHLMHVAATHPRYEDITEDEFRDTLCLQRNITMNPDGNGTASAYGLGMTLASFNMTLPQELESEVYLEAAPADADRVWDFLQQRVTLTDNRNYAFILNCWTGVGEVAWAVVSRTPSLPQQTRMIVEEHAKDIGFDPENFMFLNMEGCGRNNRRNVNETRAETPRRRGLLGVRIGRVQSEGDTETSVIPLEIRQQRLKRLMEQEEQDRRDKLALEQNRLTLDEGLRTGETFVRPVVVNATRFGDRIGERRRKP